MATHHKKHGRCYVQDLVLREQWCTLPLLLASARSWGPGEDSAVDYSALWGCVKEFWQTYISSLHPCSSHGLIIVHPVRICHNSLLILRIGDVNAGLPEQERYAAVDDNALRFESNAILQVFNPTFFWYIIYNGFIFKGSLQASTMKVDEGHQRIDGCPVPCRSRYLQVLTMFQEMCDFPLGDLEKVVIWVGQMVFRFNMREV